MGTSDETFPGERALIDAAAGDLQMIDTGEPEQQLLDKLPPPPDNPDDMLVVTSLRIPLGTQRRLREYAEQHGTTPSALIRELVEERLAVDEDRLIPLSDAVRALAQLRSTTPGRAA